MKKKSSGDMVERYHSSKYDVNLHAGFQKNYFGERSRDRQQTPTWQQ